MIVWFLLGLDLLLKYRTVNFSGDYAVINPDVSFGVLISSEWIYWIVISVIFVWMYRQKLWLILAGGAGNVISRIVWGGVVDYWNFFGLVHNNLADWMIGIGFVVYGVEHFQTTRILRESVSRKF